MIIFCSACSSYNSSERGEILSTYNAFIQSLKAKDNDRILAFFPRDIYQHCSIDSITEVLDADYSGDVSHKLATIVSDSILNISRIEETGEKKYALVSYVVNVRMNLKQKEHNPDTDLPKMYIIIALEKRFGEENVHFDPVTEIVNYKVSRDAYFILEPENNNTKILPLNESTSECLRKIIPPEILKTLSTNKSKN